MKDQTIKNHSDSFSETLAESSLVFPFLHICYSFSGSLMFRQSVLQHQAWDLRHQFPVPNSQRGWWQSPSEQQWWSSITSSYSGIWCRGIAPHRPWWQATV